MLSVRKSISSLILALVMFLIFTSCSSGTTNKTYFDNKKESTENVSIKKSIYSISEYVDGSGLPPCKHCVVLDNGTVIDASYHQFSSKLIEYIGYEAFQDWTKKYSNPEDINILTYVSDNKIPREYIDEINSSSDCYYYDYNTDALYSDNPEAYYTSDRVEKTLVRAYLRNFKSGLSAWIKKSDSYEAWIAAKDSTSIEKISTTFQENMRQWNIVEAVRDFNISRDIIEYLDERASVSSIGLCSIDIDALYDSNTDELNILKVDDESLMLINYSKYMEIGELFVEGYELDLQTIH